MCVKSQTALDRLAEKLKRLDDLNNIARAKGERVLYARSVLKQSFIDCYAEKKISLLLHAKVCGEGNVVGRRLLGSPSTSLVNETLIVLQYDACDASVRCERDQKSMLIPLVKSVYSPNKVIPSTVRAYLVKHQVEQPWAGNIYFVPAQATFQSFKGLINGKFGILTDGAGSRQLDSFDPSIVQGAFEVVDNIPNSQGYVGKDFLSIYDVVNKGVVGKIRIDIDARHITVWQVGDPLFQFLNVMVGPFDLCSGVAKFHAR